MHMLDRAVGIVLVIGLMAGAAEAGWGPLFSEGAYLTGGAPCSVAFDDLDGDGVLDLAVANRSGSISVLLGVGDDILDLAAANAGDDDVSVLLGVGDGTFATAVDYAVGYAPRFVALGDLNADDVLDLAVTNVGDDNVSVRLGNGDGTFDAASFHAVGSEPYSVAIGDLDGDGRSDLAVANYHSDNVTVLLNQGGLSGDLNCDGALNAFDIGPFVMALSNPAAYAAAFPYCNRGFADINDDGRLNAFDIDPFVGILAGGE